MRDSYVSYSARREKAMGPRLIKAAARTTEALPRPGCRPAFYTGHVAFRDRAGKLTSREGANFQHGPDLTLEGALLEGEGRWH